MRIPDPQLNFIKAIIGKIRPSAEVYLFGSRIQENLKGGDIDLLIIDENPLTIAEKSTILMKFWSKFGEQKVDLVCFTPDSDTAFKEMALEQGIKI